MTQNWDILVRPKKRRRKSRGVASVEGWPARNREPAKLFVDVRYSPKQALTKGDIYVKMGRYETNTTFY